MRPFRDRSEAGQLLARRLEDYRNRSDVLVLGLPRGGVPVAHAVARALNSPLDVMIVRKIGAPGQPELAVGAVASGGVVVWNDELAMSFDRDLLKDAAHAQREEVARRERLYRGHGAPLSVRNRTVLLVDDGAATGASMLAAVRALRTLDPQRIVVALPVASAEAHERLSAEADEVVCVLQPPAFYSVWNWYEDFTQTTDDAVRSLLRANTSMPPTAST